jgi:uncharacterized membrane protein (DUF2068 family)
VISAAPASASDQVAGHAPGESRWLKWLAAIRIVEGIILCVVAVELVEIIGRDLDALLEQWVRRVHVDPHNPIIIGALGYAREAGTTTLEEVAGLSGAFGGLNLLQGVGLWYRRAWAEYVCVLSTALFIPFEIHELILEPHVVSAGMLLVNAAIVAFLMRRLGARPASRARA